MLQKTIQRQKNSLRLQPHDNLLNDTELQMPLANYMRPIRQKAPPQSTIWMKILKTVMFLVFLYSVHTKKKKRKNENSLNRLLEQDRKNFFRNYELFAFVHQVHFLCCLDSFLSWEFWMLKMILFLILEQNVPLDHLRNVTASHPLRVKEMFNLLVMKSSPLF